MAKRKTARRKTKKRTKTKKKGKKRGKPFGGLKIKPDAALSKVIGSSAVAPSIMTKKLWVYIKRKRLMRR